jgi:hypothetical protein
MPLVNESWHGVNRSGDVICDAKIEKILLSKKQDHTAMVTVSVPVEHLHDFVTIRARHE